jgi:hypothetical protein
MKKIRIVPALLLLLLAAACARDTTQPEGAGATKQVSAGDTVRLGVNQSARIAASGIVVKFTGIGEDSRCPIDAVCVWAGRAEAKLELTAPGQPVTAANIFSFTEPRHVDYHGYRIRLVEVSPVARAEETIGPGDYVVGLEITSL